MKPQLLTAALLKAAFDIHPLRTGEMAGYGAALGGLAGGGIGAAAGLIGTESGSPERRKAMLQRGLMGLLAGAGVGGVGGLHVSGGLRDSYDKEYVPAKALSMPFIEMLAAQQMSQAGLKMPSSEGDGMRLKNLLSGAMDQTYGNQMQKVRVPAGALLGGLFNSGVSGARTAIDKNFSPSDAQSSDGSQGINLVWDAIKEYNAGK